MCVLCLGYRDEGGSSHGRSRQEKRHGDTVTVDSWLSALLGISVGHSTIAEGAQADTARLALYFVVDGHSGTRKDGTGTEVVSNCSACFGKRSMVAAKVLQVLACRLYVHIDVSPGSC